jgi:hypothetical protein
VVIGVEKGKRGGNNRGGRNGNRAQSAPATEMREQKKDQASTPLYGRIG